MIFSLPLVAPESTEETPLLFHKDASKPGTVQIRFPDGDPFAEEAGYVEGIFVLVASPEKMEDASFGAFEGGSELIYLKFWFKFTQ